jgi:hypothetical protein
MAWVRRVGGRIKSDFRYSNGMVYNTFSWPEGITEARRQAVRDAAQAVLDVRAAHRGDTLAALYDPDVMPEALRDAHRTLDRAVDRCYRGAPFAGDDARFAMLLERYVAQTGASP